MRSLSIGVKESICMHAGTTNEALRLRLALLSSQLRHRDMDIDSLRNDVRRLRDLMAQPAWPPATVRVCRDGGP